MVAIVGYPNVGKSTLFNRLAGRRDAVVDAAPGVTRDRRQAGAEWNGRAFQLLDTGGIDEADPSDVGRQVAAQAAAGDRRGRPGPVRGQRAAPRPRRATWRSSSGCAAPTRPLMLVANKADDRAQEAAAENLRGPRAGRPARGLGPARPGDRGPPGRDRGPPAGRPPGRRRRRARAGDLHHRPAQRRQELDPQRAARRGAGGGARAARHDPRPRSTRRSRSTGARSS